MTNRNRPVRTAVVATLVLSAALPSIASAQLGRLKKAAAEAAKEAAGVKTETPAATNASTSNNFVITANRLSAVVAFMDAGMERAAKEAAANAARRDYETRRDTYGKCLEAQIKTLTSAPPSMAAMQNAAGMADKSTGLTKRMSAAQQAKRWPEYVATSDTLQIVALQQTLTMYGAPSKCGAPVYMPPVLIADEAAKMNRQASGDYSSSDDEAVIPPAQRGGMTTQQFGMIRERAALWALQQTNNAPVGNSKYGVFTPDEQAALETHGAKLKKWAPVFKESPSTWATWGNIKSW